MNAATLPATLEAAHQLIEQLQWRVAQLEQELFGPSSERQAEGRLSKAQICCRSSRRLNPQPHSRCWCG